MPPKMSTAASARKFNATYWLPRLYVGVFGTFVVFVAPFIFFLREWLDDQVGALPSPIWEDALISVAVLLFGLACTLPFSWTKNGWRYKLRLAWLVVFGLWIVFNNVRRIPQYVETGAVLQVVMAICFILLCVLAPVTLFIYKRDMAA